MTALLEVRGLTIHAPGPEGPRAIVRDASFTVAAGESLGIVGESGSGKSMTVRAIMRLLPPGFEVGGEVHFDGRPVLEMSRSDLQRFRANDVAMIFQDPRAHTTPVRTIGDFLTEGLRRGGAAREDAERRVLGLLEELGVTRARERLAQYPHEVSGGQLQRVMIAAALVAEPRLLIADEPTTALDVTTQSDVVAALGELRRERDLALVFITHDLELAAATCDRIAVLYAGALAEEGPADVLEGRPAHPYTQALLRSRPQVARRLPRLLAIPGRPVSAHEVPEGCSFHPRCPYALDLCRQEAPVLRPVPDGQGVAACHRLEEVVSGRLEPEREIA
jgi:oligopeptide/dipeptide ABC transporter ATP-binding protein